MYFSRKDTVRRSYFRVHQVCFVNLLRRLSPVGYVAKRVTNHPHVFGVRGEEVTVNR